MRTAGELLGAWNGFYVMVGSAAAGLTGLMFVVITLVSGDKRTATPTGVATFSSPTVRHFCVALFTAAVMSAPFHSLRPVEILLALAGLVGMYYVVVVAIQTATLATYTPDAEDWSWHVGLPFIAYLALAAGAFMVHVTPELALYVPAAAAVLLIFIGIHNAWDVITFLATGDVEPQGDKPRNDDKPKVD